MTSSPASSKVTSIRSRAGAAGLSADAELTLRALATDATVHPDELDAFADENPELRPIAATVAALARLADDRDDAAAGRWLSAVLDVEPGEPSLAVAERLPASVRTRAAGVALLCAAERHSDVLALTHGLVDVDDVTALLLVYRACALAAVGFHVAATDTWSGVVQARRHDPQIRRLARDLRAAAWSDGR